MALSSSRKHLHTVPLGQLRFFRRAAGRLRGWNQGGFAGVSVSAAGMTIAHYNEHAKMLYSHTVAPRAALRPEKGACSAFNESGRAAAVPQDVPHLPRGLSTTKSRTLRARRGVAVGKEATG